MASTSARSALWHGLLPAGAAGALLRLPAESARGARYEHRGGRARRDAAAGVRRRQGRLALSGRSGRGFVAVPADAAELRGPLVLASPRRQSAVAVARALADAAQRAGGVRWVDADHAGGAQQRTTAV